ncbi:MAG: Glutamate racemase, partial [uncultured Sphingomonas sp.]
AHPVLRLRRRRPVGAGSDAGPAAPCADRLRRRQCRLPVRHPHGGGDRGTGAGAARAAGGAVPSSVGGDRLQHGLHHRACGGAGGAGNPGGRHRPGDQAGRRAVEDPSHWCAWHASHRPSALCGRPHRALCRRLHGGPPWFGGAGRAGRSQACRRTDRARRDRRGSAADARSPARGEDGRAGACLHPLSAAGGGTCRRPSQRPSGRRRCRDRPPHRPSHQGPAVVAGAAAWHGRVHRRAATAVACRSARGSWSRRVPQPV